MAERAAGVTRPGEQPPYLALVVEHYRRPLHRRSLDAPTHVHEGTNASCGDRLRVELLVRDGIIADAGFQASACAIATASASLLMDRVRGAGLAEVAAISDRDVQEALGEGVPPGRASCATLSLRILRAALESAQQPEPGA